MISIKHLFSKHDYCRIQVQTLCVAENANSIPRGVVSQDGDEDGEAGEGGEPLGDLDVVLALREQAAPARCGRLDAMPRKLSANSA